MLHCAHRRLDADGPFAAVSSTCPRCAARPSRARRSSSPSPADTTSSSRDHRARARPCWLAGSRPLLRSLEPRRWRPRRSIRHSGWADGLVEERPFRSPHHTISSAALLGGGSAPRPGEISLAHNGVLFLDELPEFNRASIEGLREPLEERAVTISRVHASLHLPASFLLVAAANPCPCGWADSRVRECVCTNEARSRYQHRLSGPLIDRIDLQTFVAPVSLSSCVTTHPVKPPHGSVSA